MTASNKSIIDLRSDTVTRPDAAMLRAMAEASLGDDVYREDDDTIRLEARGAERLGYEAALFLPSGTMANQIALHLHTRPGDEVLVPTGAHVANNEVGAGAALSGLAFVSLTPRSIEDSGHTQQAADGMAVDATQLRAQLEPRGYLQPRVGCLVLENTLNRLGGLAYDPKSTAAAFALASAAGVATHLDGARLGNAAVALGCELKSMTHGADSTSFCLSKGLGAPVGSLLAGSRDFIAEALRVRKRWGGGMRQTGPLARAGLVALDRIGDLAEDHRRAAILRERLAVLGQQCALFAVATPAEQPAVRLTNMVMLQSTNAAKLAADFDAAGVRCHAMAQVVRLVVHRDLSDRDIDDAFMRIRDVCSR